MSKGWIGVDLDGTLAHYDYGDKDWSPTKIGAPIPAMVARVRRWLDAGHDVRIFTARVSHDESPQRMIEAAESEAAIRRWCVQHLGASLPVTNVKDYHMWELWDDRAVQVIANTGEPVGTSSRGLA